jgi:hypothetical protein
VLISEKGALKSFPRLEAKCASTWRKAVKSDLSPSKNNGICSEWKRSIFVFNKGKQRKGKALRDIRFQLSVALVRHKGKFHTE